MSILAPKPIRRADANPYVERLLDSEDAASFPKIHPKTFQRMARSGEIAGVFGSASCSVPLFGFELVAAKKCGAAERAFLSGLIILYASGMARMRQTPQQRDQPQQSAVYEAA